MFTFKVANLYHRFVKILRNNTFGNYLSKFITLIVLGALGIYLYQNQESLKRIKEFNIIDITIVITLQLSNLFLLGLFNLVMLKRIDPKIAFSDAILLQYVNNFLNNILSKGGGVYRALYLKARYNFPFSRFISAITGLYVITFLTNGFLGIISLKIISMRFEQNELILLFIFFASFLSSLSIIIFKPKIRQSQNRFYRILNSIFIGWNQIRNNSQDIIYLILLSLLNLILNTFQLMYIYRTLGSNVNWISMVILGTLATITQILTITPSGIGIREAVFALSSKLIFISDEILVLGSLILRAIAIPSSIIAGSISYSILQKRMSDKPIKISDIKNSKDTL